MSDKFRFAVLGLGHIGKRHAEMINGNENAELVAIADNSDTIINRIKGNYDVPSFNSLDGLLKAELGIDVVNICTPNGLHAEHSINVLENGMHVVCEKPMALKKADCEEIIFKSLQTSKHVFVVKQNRFSPTSVWLKSIVQEKVLGAIYMVQINCYWNRNDSYYTKSDWKGTMKLDGGPLFTQFSHFIDIMYWLFGDIVDIRAQFEYFKHKQATEFEDSGFVNFRFVNGGIGSLNYSTAVHESNLESSITIIGEKGTIRVGGQYMQQVECCNIKGYEMPKLTGTNPPNNYGEYKGSAANHHYIIQNVVDTLSGKAIASANALEGLKVVEMIERIYSHRR